MYFMERAGIKFHHILIKVETQWSRLY